MTIRVAIADDHSLVRQGLRRYLDMAEGIEVVGEAANGQELVDHILVVRCHPIQGAGSVHHVGAKFLLTESPTRQTVRHAIGQATSHTVPAAFPSS